MGRRFDDSFFDGRPELLRYRAAEDLVFEDKAVAARQWFKDALAIAELPAPTRLFLVTPLHLGPLSNCFFVRDFGRVQHHFDAVTFFEFVDDRLDVYLA